jgi:hypothetical protein
MLGVADEANKSTSVQAGLSSSFSWRRMVGRSSKGSGGSAPMRPRGVLWVMFSALRRESSNCSLEIGFDGFVERKAGHHARASRGEKCEAPLPS